MHPPHPPSGSATAEVRDRDETRDAEVRDRDETFCIRDETVTETDTLQLPRP